MTPDERRKAQKRRNESSQPIWHAVRNNLPGITTLQADTVALAAYDNLLAYFDEHEPAVADAIRYGLTDQWPMAQGYRINYPQPDDSDSRNDES